MNLCPLLRRFRQTALIMAAATLTLGFLPEAVAVPGLAPVLTPFSPDSNGIISGLVTHQLTYTGTATRFAATGLPRGLTLNTVTGLVSGRPLVAGNFTMIFTAWNGAAKSAPLTVLWTVEPLPVGTAGTYNALLDRQEWLNGGYGGTLRLTVNADGTFSGVINRGYHRHSIVGRLDTQPGGEAPVGLFSLTRRSPYLPLQVAFTLPIGTGQIFGVIQEPNGPAINLFGYRAAYSATVPATAFAGRWNTAYELPGELVGNAAYPQGAAWATQTVSAAGLVTWTGRMADGTTFTHSTGLAQAGQTLLHVMLYNSNGSVQGWQTLNSLTNLTAATLDWYKTITGGRSYPTGIPLHTLTGLGGKYTAPTAGNLIFGIGAGANNAIFTFTQGGLTSAYTQLLTVGALNKLSFPTGGANPYKISASLDVLTGIITGTGTVADFLETGPSNQRAASFSALLIPNSEKAVGHFLLPTTKTTTSPILSGKLVGQEVNYFD